MAHPYGAYMEGTVEGIVEGGLYKAYAEDFPSQSHFYIGKLLRRAPLRAISRSFSHPISVTFPLLGCRDLVEQDQISL
jgi:hypothetical protein